MDRERVNTKFCYVTADGQLENRTPSSRGQQGSRRFNHYVGTCSTSPIPIIPSHPPLTPVPHAAQYWETETTVGLVKKKRERWRSVLEVGVVEEDQLDSERMGYYRPRFWCVRIGWCDTHQGYCTQVWNRQGHVKCMRDILIIPQGESQKPRHGVVIDTVRGRLGFVDVDRGVVLEKMDVEFRQTVYPVFGVWPDPANCTVQMRLVTGSHIQMTEDKQKLIYSCLT